MSDPSAPESNGRLPSGRWAPGNRHGQGNPQHRRMAELRAAMLDEVQPADVQELTRKLIGLAREGDVAAARLVLEYALGKPPTAVSITGPEGESLGDDVAKLGAALLEAVKPFGDVAKLRVLLALQGVIDGSGDAAPDPAR
jgi:hypothetical protein